MALTAKTAITRTVTISDLTPQEMASIFTGWYDDEQAAFFDAIKAETVGWPGSGWCGQACAIAQHLKPEGRDVIVTLAAHVTAPQ